MLAEVRNSEAQPTSMNVLFDMKEQIKQESTKHERRKINLLKELQKSKLNFKKCGGQTNASRLRAQEIQRQIQSYSDLK